MKKRMEPQRAQRPQRSFLESPPALLTFREASEMGPLFPLHPGLELLAIFASAFSATAAVKFFYFRPLRGFCPERMPGGDWEKIRNLQSEIKRLTPGFGVSLFGKGLLKKTT
jgi:hypothetical protein